MDNLETEAGAAVHTVGAARRAKTGDLDPRVVVVDPAPKVESAETAEPPVEPLSTS